MKNNYGAILKQYRRDAKITQKQMASYYAKEFGESIHWKSFSLAERCKVCPNANMILIYLNYCKIPIDEVL